MEGKSQNAAKKDMVDWQNSLKGAKKIKNYLIYGKIKGAKEILFIYIGYINYTVFLALFFIFVRCKKLLIIL